MKYLVIFLVVLTSCNRDSVLEKEIDKQIRKQSALNKAGKTQLSFKNYAQAEKYLQQSDSVSKIIDSLLAELK